LETKPRDVPILWRHLAGSEPQARPQVGAMFAPKTHMTHAVKVLLIVVAAMIGYEVARATPPKPIVVTVSDEVLQAGGGRAPRSAALPAAQTAQGVQGAQTTTAAQAPCTSPAPDASSTCVNGFWQAPAAAATGAARFDRENGCVTIQPANDMVCRNGLWVLRGTEATTLATQPVTPGAASSPTADPNPVGTVPATAAGASGPASGCLTPPPPVPGTQTVACVNGTWVVR
jgi:hypothetical protein